MINIDSLIIGSPSAEQDWGTAVYICGYWLTEASLIRLRRWFSRSDVGRVTEGQGSWW